MKKLFLLLILFFFSIQSYAGSCPDGSDPVRSISDDGTYFVFNCESDTKINVNVKNQEQAQQRARVFLFQIKTSMTF